MKVCNHFFDALGRETNTVVRLSAVPGAAVEAGTVALSEAVTTETTDYPCGTSDFVVHTDTRGVRTETVKSEAFDCVWTGITVFTNDVWISEESTTAYRNGRTVTEHLGRDGLWTRETRFTEYADDGTRREVTTREASDHGIITNRVVFYDTLFRVTRTFTPLSEIVNTYDGTSSRVLTAHDLKSGVVTTYTYNARGERVGETRGGVTVGKDDNLRDRLQ